jgi:DNA-3-methyladenine glycosylase I
MASEADWKFRGVIKGEDGRKRCPWCLADAAYMDYHDDEWGRPVHDDQRLFEMLCLEGAQAGLSWLTILRKRATYRRAFDNFDARKMARYKANRKARLMKDAGIVRNRLKIEAFVLNARALLEIHKDGSFDELLWQFAPTVRTASRRPKRLGEIPSSTPESDAMSRELKKRGFKFVGSTICYAFMQAVGMVDDHLAGCSAIRRPPGVHRRRQSASRSAR